MARVAKLWGKAPSDYTDYEPGGIEAYLLDTGLAFRMSAEDAKTAAQPPGMREMKTDHATGP